MRRFCKLWYQEYQSQRKCFKMILKTWIDKARGMLLVEGDIPLRGGGACWTPLIKRGVRCWLNGLVGREAAGNTERTSGHFGSRDVRSHIKKKNLL